MTKKIHSYSGKEFYSRTDVADTYDSMRFTSGHGKLVDYDEKKILFSLLKEVSAESSSGLEVGSGTGRFSIALAENGYHMTASDISPAMQATIQKKLDSIGKDLKGSVKLKIADAYNLPFKENSFDFVICIRVLNQLKLDKDKMNAIREITKVVKPGGTVVLEYINGLSLSIFSSTFQKMVKSFSMEPYRNSGLITPGKFKKLVRRRGLQVEKTKGTLIFSHTLYRILPEFLHKPVYFFDMIFSAIFPFFCTRVYIKAKKVE